MKSYKSILFYIAVAALAMLFGPSELKAQRSNITPLKKSKDRANKAMNDILRGPFDVPSSSSYYRNSSEGSGKSACDTKDGSLIDKSVTKLADGMWQVATFWYHGDECK